MTDILSLRRNVALVSKHAPDFIVEEALFDAAQQLCVDAEVWQAMVEIDVSMGDGEISVSAPTGAQLVRVMWATLGDTKLEAVDHVTYATTFSDGNVGNPRYYYQVDARNLVVYPTPTTSLVGQARAVCSMRSGSTTLPDDIFSLYREALIFGALSRVLATPGDFGDPRLANAYEQKWYAAISAAKGRATRSKDNTVLVATYGGY